MLKRKLAAVLAGAMILSSLPMVSFAASDNRVTRVPKLAKEKPIQSELVITPKDGRTFTEGEAFRLKLENAKWLKEDVNKVDVLRFLNDSTVEVTAKQTVSDGVYNRVYNPKTGTFTINFNGLTETTEVGDVKVTIDPRDSIVSGGTYTIAVVGSDKTVATINDVKKFSNSVVLDTIEIDELYVGAIDKTELILELANDDFSWDMSSFTIQGAGGIKLDSTFNKVDKDSDTLPAEHFKIDGDEVIIKLPTSILDSRTDRGSLLIDGLKIKASRDADFEVVEIDIRGEAVSKQTLEVAEYVDFGVAVKVDEKNDITAGYGKEKYEITIEETIARSWFSERRTLIEFPEYVRLVGTKDSKGDYVKPSDIDIKKADSDNIENFGTYEIDKDGHWIEFLDIVKDESDKKAKFVFEVELEVESGAEGDIIATVSGTGLEEEIEVELGKVETPFDVEVEPVDLKVGVKTQKVGDIVITETADKKLPKGTVLTFKLEDDDLEWITEPEVETTAGIEVEVDINKENDILTVEVTKASRKEAGTITLTGGEVKVTRSVPEGTYNLIVTTSKEDWNGWGDWFDDVYVNIITPNTHDIQTMKPAKATAVFTANSVNYTINGVVATADAAPYIDAQNRLMVPVKYVAYGLGVDPANVLYNDAAKVVTIMDGDRIVQLTIGSKIIKVNGAEIEMDTVATIDANTGRSYVPMGWLAKALGVKATWDNETKSATFN